MVEFEAVIIPYRSMSTAGLRRVAALLLLLSAGVSTLLWTLGAWPVVGFNGVEMGVALLLLRRNALDRRASERLRLTRGGLQVRRIDRTGQADELVVDVAWLQAVLHERPGRTPLLLLVGRGRPMEVGASLGEAEKRDLAEALRAALYRQRHPTFDNPQLQAPTSPPAAPST